MNKETLILTRIPPGDNWNSVSIPFKTFSSLTEALSFAYKETKIKEFHVSAQEGKVWIIEEVEDIKNIEIDSLYGD